MGKIAGGERSQLRVKLFFRFIMSFYTQTLRCKMMMSSSWLAQIIGLSKANIGCN